MVFLGRTRSRSFSRSAALEQHSAVTSEVRTNIQSSVTALTMFGALNLMVRAYSLGGGTYTGIEAVSNGVG